MHSTLAPDRLLPLLLLGLVVSLWPLTAPATTARLPTRVDLVQAQAHCDAGRYFAAVTLLEPLAAEHDTDPDLLFLLAYARHKAGQDDAARAPARRAAQLDPGYQDAAYLAGLLAYRAGDASEAQLLLEQAQALAPDSALGRSAAEHLARLARARDVRPALERGLAEVRRGDYAHALPLLHRAEMEHPQEPLVRYYLGYCWFQLGDWARAEEALRKAVQLAPDDRWSALLLGLSEMRLGRTAVARQRLAALRAAVAEDEPGRLAAATLVQLGAQVSSTSPSWLPEPRLASGLYFDSDAGQGLLGVPGGPAAGENAAGFGAEGTVGLALRQDAVHDLRAEATIAALLFGAGARTLDRARGQLSLVEAASLGERLGLLLRADAEWSDYGWTAPDDRQGAGAALRVQESRRTASWLDLELGRRGLRPSGYPEQAIWSVAGTVRQELGPWSGHGVSLGLRLGYGVRADRGETQSWQLSETVPAADEAGADETATLVTRWSPSLDAHGPDLLVYLGLPAGLTLTAQGRLTWVTQREEQSIRWIDASGESAWSATASERRLAGRLMLSWYHRGLVASLGADVTDLHSSLSLAEGAPFDPSYGRLVSWLALGWCGASVCNMPAGAAAP